MEGGVDEKINDYVDMGFLCRIVRSVNCEEGSSNHEASFGWREHYREALSREETFLKVCVIGQCID